MSSHARPHLRVIVLKLALVWSSIFLIGLGRCEAFQIQESDPEQKSLVTVKDLTLIGGYRVPNFFIDGKNIVSALGSMDLRWDENGEAVWIVQHGSGHLIELRE